MFFLYFSAYLTGIGALLERLDDSNSQVSVKVVCGILLVFYVLVPVAFCALPGIRLTKKTKSKAPDDSAEYIKWLEEQSKGSVGPLFTIIAPFEKNTPGARWIYCSDGAHAGSSHLKT